MSISIPDDLALAKSVVSLARSLQKRFDLTRSGDLEKAIELACCLQVLTARANFVRYMDSFIYDISYKSNSYAWGHKCDGLALLAYDADSHSDDSLRTKALEIITSKNFDANDLGWLLENARGEIEAHKEEREGAELLAQAGEVLDLTVKEKQQGHYSRIVLFAYYHQLLKAFMPDTAVPEVAELSVLIERERRSLSELLSERKR
ncbi:hypothetical protein [Marinobacter sp. KMM 10035]|uniref:hypothetical protein n=1 Tax=Marinobacter sp. KMM 10035 TaxID=3134034 RepID=UPI00397BF471